MNKLTQYRILEKVAVLFSKEHLITILDHTVGPGTTDRGALRLMVPTVFEKLGYRSASGISVPGEAGKGALFGGLMFTPYGMQAAGGIRTRGKKSGLKKLRLGRKRKAFIIPVTIGAGLGALSKGLMAKSHKNLIKTRGRKALHVVNIRERENVAATRGQARGLVTGIVAGGGIGAGLGKLISKASKFKKLKRIGALSGAVWGGSLAGLAGASIGESMARRRFQRRNILRY
jgi:hypothetical protein